MDGYAGHVAVGHRPAVIVATQCGKAIERSYRKSERELAENSHTEPDSCSGLEGGFGHRIQFQPASQDCGTHTRISFKDLLWTPVLNAWKATVLRDSPAVPFSCGHPRSALE